MSELAPQTPELNSVTIMLRNGKWMVRVVDDGEIREQDFDLEAHAHSFAQGQRFRLGLVNALL